MRKFIPKFTALLGGSCFAVAVIIGALIFLSEKYIGAGNDFIYSPSKSSNNLQTNNENAEIYVSALEKLRGEYANIKTIEMEANVTIEIFKNNSTVSGTGRVNYAAQDNKYKYVCSVSENLQNEGLMRDVDVLFNGTKFYFYDRESKIVSFQASEEVRFPSALPNPFFLPIEYLSNDDDSCENCKMRLQDVKMPIRWAKRVSSISELNTETNNGITHSLIQMPGGDLNKAPYNYRVRLVGETTDKLQPISIARVKENGLPLVEVLLSDLRTVQGMNAKIPYVVEVGARDDAGRLVLKTVFTITTLKINQTFADNLLAPNFAGSERYWDSDKKMFAEQ